ncbi:MAG: hypothetical protein NC453_21475 [Muribaculum sp.]|nr:hypothetical protein [Muribaculum sp.]
MAIEEKINALVTASILTEVLIFCMKQYEMINDTIIGKSILISDLL